MIILLNLFLNFAYADFTIQNFDQVKTTKKIDIIESDGTVDFLGADLITNGRVDASNLQVDDLPLQYIDGPINSLQDLSVSIDNRFANVIEGLALSNVLAETGEVQTTSTNDILLNGMTVTPPAGQYIVFAFTHSAHNSSNGITWFSLYGGGVQAPNTLASLQRGGGQFVNVKLTWFASAKMTLNGSQAIEIRWRSQSGTARTFSRNIIYLKVGN